MAELRQAVQRARPGTTIEIAMGFYEGGIFASNLHGTAMQPITLRGKSPADPPIFRGGGTGIHLSRVSHIVLENLRVQKCSANGINIDDGGNRSKPSTNIRLIDVMVEDLPKGNHDGIKLSGVREFSISRVRVENWGGSAVDMVGCHNGLIELGTFVNGGDNAIQTKGGSSNITIEKSDFLNAGERAG